MTAKGPGFYADIGKKTRDLLYRDYQNDHKITVTTYTSNGVTTSSSVTKKGDLLLVDLLTTITVDERLKTIFSIAVPDQRSGSGRVELQYFHKSVGINAGIGLTANPIVNISSLIGNNRVSVGADVSFDTSTGNFTKVNVGFNFTHADLIASMTLNTDRNGKDDTLNASYYHIVNPLTNTTAAGAELTYSFATNESTLTFGTQHALDSLTSVKARVDNFGKANALIQHEWRPNSLFTFSGELDTRSVKKTAKVGLAIALKP